MRVFNHQNVITSPFFRYLQSLLRDFFKQSSFLVILIFFSKTVNGHFSQVFFYFYFTNSQNFLNNYIYLDSRALSLMDCSNNMIEKLISKLTNLSIDNGFTLLGIYENE